MISTQQFRTPTISSVPTTETMTTVQLDRCRPIYDDNRHEWFYKVESEHDPLVEYEVRWDSLHGCFTCTCPCGLDGFATCTRYPTCKHVRWTQAHWAHHGADLVAGEDSWLNEQGHMSFYDWM